MQLLDDCMNIDCRDSVKRGGYPEFLDSLLSLFLNI